MKDNYPCGAYSDPNAPYNQVNTNVDLIIKAEFRLEGGSDIKDEHLIGELVNHLTTYLGGCKHPNLSVEIYEE
jgi:hypothetical protein